jgi:hypothetical protein
MRRTELSPRPQQVQPRQVLTRQEVGDVARRQPQPATGDLHEVLSGISGTPFILLRIAVPMLPPPAYKATGKCSWHGRSR